MAMPRALMVRGVQRSSTSASNHPAGADCGIEPADIGGMPEAVRRRDDEHRLECRDRHGAAEERRRQRAKHRVAAHDRGGT